MPQPTFDAPARVGGQGTSLSFNIAISASVTQGAVLVGFLLPTAAVLNAPFICTIDGRAARLIRATADPFSRTAQLRVYGIATGGRTGSVPIAASWSGTHSIPALAYSFDNVQQDDLWRNDVESTTDFGQSSISRVILSTGGDLTVDFVGTPSSTAPSSPSGSPGTQTAQGLAQTVNSTDAGAIWGSTMPGSASNTHGWTTATNGSYQIGLSLVGAFTEMGKSDDVGATCVSAGVVSVAGRH